MCTPLPAQVISVHGGSACASIGGQETQMDCRAYEDLQPGDWVLVYLGQVVSRISPEEAEALRELLRELQGD